MRSFIARLLADRSGATTLEYALIISLVFLVIISAVTVFAETATGLFNTAIDKLRLAIAG